MLKIVYAVGTAALLSACGSSSAILIGKARPPIAPEAVKLYLDAPKSYERIALLESTSKASWAATDQGKTNKMIERLKEEAAKVGANGVLITSTGNQQEGGGVFIPTGQGGGVFAPTTATHKSGNGIAIYVPEE
jgi:hypothetical protein